MWVKMGIDHVETLVRHYSLVVGVEMEEALELIDAEETIANDN